MHFHNEMLNAPHNYSIQHAPKIYKKSSSSVNNKMIHFCKVIAWQWALLWRLIWILLVLHKFFFVHLFNHGFPKPNTCIYEPVWYLVSCQTCSWSQHKFLTVIWVAAMFANFKQKQQQSLRWYLKFSLFFHFLIFFYY